MSPPRPPAAKSKTPRSKTARAKTARAKTPKAKTRAGKAIGRLLRWNLGDLYSGPGSARPEGAFSWSSFSMSSASWKRRQARASRTHGA